MELRLFGPPGTGKTTRIAERVSIAAEKFGAHRVLVSSFTRAAARTLTGRGLPILKQNVGTLHALCFRAFEQPTIAETRIADFNERAGAFALSVDNPKSVDDPSYERIQQTTRGDSFMLHYQQLRARMVPRTAWPKQVLGFANQWEKWKRQEDVVDFTDLIERAIDEFPIAPGMPTVGFFDEAQDFSRLQMCLVRTWAKGMDYALFAGDDDQLLYDFAGATPDAFLKPEIPEKQKEVLSQSYRVPSAVHKVAESWIKQIKDREIKEYKPRDYDGEFSNCQATLAQPRPVLKIIEKYLADNESVMILASCAYMLKQTIALLRESGIPFHNPYRIKRGDWNPISRRKNATVAADRVLAFMFPSMSFPPVWSMQNLADWIDPLSTAGLLRRGQKNTAKGNIEEEREMPEKFDHYVMSLLEMFTETGVNELLEQLEKGPCAEWYFKHVLPSKKRSFEFVSKIIKKRGAESLKINPRVIVGTIHSVKGGEADNVFVMPDISIAGFREWNKRKEGRDAIVRMMYVAITRARKRVHLCNPATSFFVKVK